MGGTVITRENALRLMERSFDDYEAMGLAEDIREFYSLDPNWVNALGVLSDSWQIIQQTMDICIADWLGG